jgi:hypothetical protein
MDTPSIDPQDLFVLDEAIRWQRRSFFVGRSDEFRSAISVLHRRSTSLVIYGERGIGKTSFAWQLLELLAREGTEQCKVVNTRLPLRKKKAVWLECTRHMESLTDLIATVLGASVSGRATLPSTFPSLFREGGVTDDIKRKYGFNIGLAKVELEFTGGKAKKMGRAREAAAGLNLSQDQAALNTFRDIIEMCERESDDGIVFFFDEVDRLPSDIGLASLVKHAGNAQFVMIGVADNVSDLLKDHESIGRKLEDVEVMGLSEPEVRSIFTLAEKVSAGTLHVEEGYKRLAAANAGGFPWVVQALGYYGAVAELEKQPATQDQLCLSEATFKAAVEALIGARQGFRSELVRNAIGDSKTKEEILKRLALTTGGLTSQEIREGLDRNLQRYVSEFLKDLCDTGVLRRRTDNRYVFKDPVVRIIVNLKTAFTD